MPQIYVSGHRNPDTDSIASAIGYAELRGRLDPDNEYVAVRLGDVNTQTRWVLERSGVDAPRFLPHVMLRIRDAMRPSESVAAHDEPVREVGLQMAHRNLDLVPVVDDDGALVGVVTERALARRYIRESHEASTLDAPTTISSIVDQVNGRLVTGSDHEVDGRVWAYAMDPTTFDSQIADGDVVVVGNRADAQQAAIALGAGLMVVSNGETPGEETLARAADRGTAVIVTPLDTYVASRMITLAAPCRAVMDTDPLTVDPDDLVSDHAADIRDIHYRAAVAVDAARRPVGLVTRSDLLDPRPRRILLVDHAEQAQSAPGIEEAEIVEILDHHHIGSIETRIPVQATFDPVGSTATLVVERFRQNGMEPSVPSATLLLGGLLSDTVILNSPTTTERDRATAAYLERALGVDAEAFGREMFESTSDVSNVPAADIVRSDAKGYETRSQERIVIAQIETVGRTLLDRRDELLDALDAAREADGHTLYALMVTDILAHSTHLLVSGDAGLVARAFGASADGRVIELEGVMSRKKQVAPRLLGAL